MRQYRTLIVYTNAYGQRAEFGGLLHPTTEAVDPAVAARKRVLVGCPSFVRQHLIEVQVREEIRPHGWDKQPTLGPLHVFNRAFLADCLEG